MVFRIFIKSDVLTVTSLCTTLIGDHNKSPGKEEEIQLGHLDAGSQVAHSQEMLLMAVASLKLPDIPIPPAGCPGQLVHSKAVILPASPLCLCAA